MLPSKGCSPRALKQEEVRQYIWHSCKRQNNHPCRGLELLSPPAARLVFWFQLLLGTHTPPAPRKTVPIGFSHINPALLWVSAFPGLGATGIAAVISCLSVFVLASSLLNYMAGVEKYLWLVREINNFLCSNFIYLGLGVFHLDSLGSVYPVQT